ncbi:carboxylate-amine ligase [Dyadobacter sp. BE34]|uniref:Putative glutamate--cysteine ligase 2 n=1 Tax=Dyadobacter fermentans TaxID=94254 RepID=A0ABU1QZ64_9BACT|nr:MULTISPECIES: carboxylate-amine ligase [Dyadobacter]MDR6806444.1 carboxylate-amine ligase [Dyadobacter fermentans]MDR7044185.1 carboxylate-amine ligase [Dyadobacter sp. BE242]MDR7198496.1 carboxylate-amine ligase [Dyadobacter sp. BE34]MDR7216458.1 carboxylate-amine ligase [Dyadobacter sp. BE31]MDR7264015.1 carboxylate-amine ligase [Dyadobacter sp. BE32]
MATFTLGIEEEFQTIDPVTRNLRSHMSKLVEDGKITLKERVKAEMHQAVVEVGTNICHNIQEAREEVTYLRKMILDLAEKQDLRVAAAGTHPFADWVDQLITDDPRYDQIIDEMRDVARGNLIFGLHVHVGIESRNEGIQIMNAVRYFLPHIYALSTNSPFWCGRNTGFKSYRSKVFDKFPRTGIPDFFSSAAEYDEYLALLIKTNCIDNGKKIWWDIRLHPFFNTIEFRMCDVPMRTDETICLAAIMQALVAKIHKLHSQNLSFRPYRRMLINENKWRAARYGISSKLIDFGKQEEVEYKILIHELLEFIDDVVDELGSRKEIEYIHQILEMGTGADRQLAVFEETGSLNAVVDYIVSETKIGIC